jgi:predicted RNase H-like HicB family nuclease
LDEPSPVTGVIEPQARSAIAPELEGETIRDVKNEHAISDTGDAEASPSMTYTVVITPGEDGWFCAQVPEVPEAISQGRSPEEARTNVSEALALALQWRAEEGEGVPEAPVKRTELERWMRSASA